MGWEGYHLWTFSINGREYDHAYGERLTREDYDTTLADLDLRPRQRFPYTYDLGDFWQHELRLEKVSEQEPSRSSPICIGGNRACLPEDCGGPWTVHVTDRWHLLHNLAHVLESFLLQKQPVFHGAAMPGTEPEDRSDGAFASRPIMPNRARNHDRKTEESARSRTSAWSGSGRTSAACT